MHTNINYGYSQENRSLFNGILYILSLSFNFLTSFPLIIDLKIVSKTHYKRRKNFPKNNIDLIIEYL